MCENVISVSPELSELVDQKNSENTKKANASRIIQQLLNLVIAKYRDLSRRSIICLGRIIDLFATDKSRYYTQPHAIIVNYALKSYWLSM